MEQTTYHLTLRRRYNDRQSVLERKVSLDDLHQYWLDEFTLNQWEYAYILITPEHTTNPAEDYIGNTTEINTK